jgi:hypothetical protein
MNQAKSSINIFSKYSLIFIYLRMLFMCLRGHTICSRLLTAPRLKSEQLPGTRRQLPGTRQLSGTRRRLSGTRRGFWVLDDGRAVHRIWRPLNKIHDRTLKFEKNQSILSLNYKASNLYGSYTTKNRSNLNTKRVKSNTSSNKLAP